LTHQNGLRSKASAPQATISYDIPSETLTLSGLDTPANYQTVLSNVTFASTGNNPTNSGANTTRTIHWIASDGLASIPFGAGNSASTNITIQTPAHITASQSTPQGTVMPNAFGTALKALGPERRQYGLSECISDLHGASLGIQLATRQPDDYAL
jgi:hypothetical protein